MPTLTAIATENPENDYDRRNMPIWSLDTLDKISQIGSIIHVMQIAAGTPNSYLRLVVKISREGVYYGYIYKRDMPKPNAFVFMPPLYYCYDEEETQS